MPTLISNYYEFSLTAMAAYAEGGLTDDLTAEGFSGVQARQFQSEFLYQTKSPNTDTGFSGTFYEILSGDHKGQFVYALRGTDFGSLSDPETIRDLLADASLGLSGVATAQIQDMINFYFQAISPEGSLVHQYTLTREQLMLPPAEPHILLGGEELVSATYLVLRESAVAPGLGILDPEAPLIVTGHSLGGHLAEVFSTLFDSVVTETYTYDGAGLRTTALSNLGNLLSNITQPVNVSPQVPSSSTVHNIAADGDIVSVLPTLTHLGTRTSFAIERPPQSANALDATLHNHSVQHLTDALAVYDTLTFLDNDLAAETISPILDSASNRGSDTLENVVNGLVSLLNVGSTVATGNRDQLYSTLKDIKAAVGENSFTIDGVTGDIASLAAGNSDAATGYRYALVNLLPFAVTSNIAATAANASRYDYDPDVYTTTYLESRAILLNHLLTRNHADIADGASVSPLLTDAYFQDDRYRFNTLVSQMQLIRQAVVGRWNESITTVSKVLTELQLSRGSRHEGPR